MIIRLIIQIATDRANVIIALANAGYDVHVEQERALGCDPTFFVVFDDKRGSGGCEELVTKWIPNM